MEYYVEKTPRKYYPPMDYRDMTVKELVDKYLRTCSQCNGLVSVCKKKCKTPCIYGQRAVELLYDTAAQLPPAPLYNGKTMIELAKEENAKKKTKEKENMVMKKGKDGRIYIENWYEKAMASGDEVSWVMEHYNTDRRHATIKVNQWRHRHESKENTKQTESQTATTEVKTEEITEMKPENKMDNNFLENKLEELMKTQERCKALMDEQYRLYEVAKSEYEKIKAKTDILCSALDICNET